MNPSVLDSVSNLAALLGKREDESRNAEVLDLAEVIARSLTEEGTLVLWSLARVTSDVLATRAAAFWAASSKNLGASALCYHDLLGDERLADAATRTNCLTGVRRVVAERPDACRMLRPVLGAFLIRVAPDVALAEPLVDLVVWLLETDHARSAIAPNHRAGLSAAISSAGERAVLADVKAGAAWAARALGELGDHIAERPLTNLINEAKGALSLFYMCGDAGPAIRDGIRLAERALSRWEAVATSLDSGTPVQEVRIARQRGKPEMKLVGKIIREWEHLFAAAAGNLFDVDVSLVPLLGRTGSFTVRFLVDGEGDISSAFESVAKAVTEANRDTLAQIFKKPGADAIHVAELLRLLTESNATVEVALLCPGDDDWRSQLTVDPVKANEQLPHAESAAIQNLDSLVIPQADRLDRLVRLVEILASGDEATPEALEVVPRQVNYYKQAARVLGLMTDGGRLTSAGRRLAAMQAALRIEALACYFEGSECGWAWVTWAKKSSLWDVDPTTAEKFLTESAPSLSENTCGRRAKTLRTWLTTMLDDKRRRAGS